MRCRVVCGRAEVMLSFWPTRRFSRVDLPTFGRPTSATCAGSMRGLAAHCCHDQLVGQPRGALLGAAPARAAARGADVELRNHAFHLELLLVRLALHATTLYWGRDKPSSLQELLQQRLRILAQRIGVELRPAADRRCGSARCGRTLESAVQKDRADNRLQRICQDRRTAEAAALEFAFAQPQLAAQIQ